MNHLQKLKLALVVFMFYYSIFHPIKGAYCFQVHEYKMCKDVDQESGLPLDVGSVFSITDDRAVIWLNFTDFHETHVIRYEWYDPDGRLYYTYDYNAEPPEEGRPWFVCWGWVLIEGYLPAYFHGIWRVKFYIDNEFAGSTTFEILSEFEEPPPPNEDPVAEADGPYSGYVDESISFSSSGSHDPDGEIEGYDWDFGDGSEHSSVENPSHVYSAAGTYTVTLTVTDSLGAQNTDTASCTVTQKPGQFWSIERVATLITIGGAAVGAVGWATRTRSERRRRKILFKELMQGVDDVYTRFKMNARQCEAELLRLKDQVMEEFKQGMITEENYDVLERRIEEYLREIREELESGGQENSRISSGKNYSA